MTTGIALCSSMMLNNAAGVPDWIHLLPSGEAKTNDGRGPYRYRDPHQLIAASLPAGSKLPVDENHSTDLAAPKGFPSPARGWITELQNRTDGIWGRVEWTDEGKTLAKGYRGISPVIAHHADGTVVNILRASLTNVPNITGLQSLHSQRIDNSPLRICSSALAQDAIAHQAKMAEQGIKLNIAEAVNAVHKRYLDGYGRAPG